MEVVVFKMFLPAVALLVALLVFEGLRVALLTVIRLLKEVAGD
jgi:hypothetical protein